MADDSFDHNIDGTGFGQPTAETCWYACYAMLFTWMNRPVSSIKDAIVKAGYDFDDYYKRGLPTKDFGIVGGVALGLVGWNGGMMSNYASDLSRFAWVLRNCGPIWCSFSWPSDHIVIVSGVDCESKQIHIINPWNRLGGFDADGQYPTAKSFQSRLNTVDHFAGQGRG